MPIDRRYVVSAILALSLSVGCSNSDFEGVRAKRPIPPPSGSYPSSEPEDAARQDKEDSKEANKEFDASVEVGPSVTLETDAMGVGVSADLLPAPDIEIVTVESFNNKYYIRLTCSKLSGDQKTCENTGQEFSFQLSDVLIGLTTESSKTSFEQNRSIEGLSQLQFSSVPPRVLADGSLEFGPLQPPNGNEQLAEVVIRLNSKNSDGSVASSYRVFFVEKGIP